MLWLPQVPLSVGRGPLRLWDLELFVTPDRLKHLEEVMVDFYAREQERARREREERQAAYRAAMNDNRTNTMDLSAILDGLRELP